MKQARFIKTTNLTIRGEQRLFRCSPPMPDRKGQKEYEYVLVSAINTSLSYETFIYPANEEGEIICWRDLYGSQPGIFNHEKALTNAGYSITI